MQTFDSLPPDGFVRLADIIGQGKPLPISKGTWYSWIRQGRAPAPIKLGPRTSAWRVRDVRQFIEELGGE